MLQSYWNPTHTTTTTTTKTALTEKKGEQQLLFKPKSTNISHFSLNVPSKVCYKQLISRRLILLYSHKYISAINITSNFPKY